MKLCINALVWKKLFHGNIVLPILNTIDENVKKLETILSVSRYLINHQVREGKRIGKKERERELNEGRPYLPKLKSAGPSYCRSCPNQPIRASSPLTLLKYSQEQTHAYNCYVNFSCCCFCVKLNTLKKQK